MAAFCQHGLIDHFRFTHHIYSVESIFYYLLPNKYCTWTFLSNIKLKQSLLFISFFPWLISRANYFCFCPLGCLASNLSSFIKSSRVKNRELCYLKAWFYFLILILRGFKKSHQAEAQNASSLVDLRCWLSVMVTEWNEVLFFRVDSPAHWHLQMKFKHKWTATWEKREKKKKTHIEQY